MLLRVGELARRTGVTVRALHHYDAIGLLRPSGRSAGGYRLYDRGDVARLHGIQTLRQLGVPLAEMAALLDGGEHALQAVITRQIAQLDRQIAQSQALRERLGSLQLLLADGRQPAMEDWLSSLATLDTYRRHFSHDELRQAFERWKACEPEWRALVQDVQAAMAQGLAPDAVELQPLVARWITLALRWMDGDFERLERWGTMLREHPGLASSAGMDRAVIDFMDDASRRRQAAVARHAGPELRQRLARTRADWQAFAERGHRLMADGVPPEAAAARELAGQWDALWDRTVDGDAALRRRLIQAYERDPLLQAGMPISAALRRYVERAAAA